MRVGGVIRRLRGELNKEDVSINFHARISINRQLQLMNSHNLLVPFLSITSKNFKIVSSLPRRAVEKFKGKKVDILIKRRREGHSKGKTKEWFHKATKLVFWNLVLTF